MSEEQGLYQEAWRSSTASSYSDSPWESISMDFITHLPKTRTGFDSITVFVDRLTKMVHLVPGKSSDTAQDVSLQFLAKVVSLHGLPKSIVSDWDARFTGSFWQALMHKLDTKTLMSSSFHPQTDGQTERTNRTLEQFLRMYIDYRQTNWDELLPLAEFAINNHVSASSGYSPFYLNFGRNPSLTDYSPKEVANPSAEELSQLIHNTLNKAKSILKEHKNNKKNMQMKRGGKWIFRLEISSY